jgi:hypothetical protein
MPTGPPNPSIDNPKKEKRTRHPQCHNLRKKPEALHFAPNPTLDFLSIEKLPEEKTQQRKKNGPE